MLPASAICVCLTAMSPVVASASTTSEWPDIDNPAAAQGGGSSDAAVVIGVEDYVFAPDIAGANDNAEAWYRHLTKTRGVPAQNVRLLRNEEATLEEMRAAAKDAASLAGEDGTVWFVFIGHGAPSKDGSDGLLVGSDAQQTATSLEARSLRRSELIQTLETGDGQPVVVIDACFSGRGQQGEQLAEGLQPLRIADLEPPKSALVLTAAKSNQYAGALPGKDVPAYSYLLLGAMRGWGDADGDGTVTADEANRYASGAMRATIKGRSQTPELGGPASTVLGGGAEAGPDLSAIVLGAPGPVDSGPADPLPAPASASQGQACTDARDCPEGTSCSDSGCRIDYAYLSKREKSATRMLIGGGITAVLGTGMTIGSALVSTQGEGGGDGIGAIIAVGTVGIIATATGIGLLSVGVKRRKEVRGLKGEYGFAPFLNTDQRSAGLGLEGRF